MKYQIGHLGLVAAVELDDPTALAKRPFTREPMLERNFKYWTSQMMKSVRTQ